MSPLPVPVVSFSIWILTTTKTTFYRSERTTGPSSNHLLSKTPRFVSISSPTFLHTKPTSCVPSLRHRCSHEDKQATELLSCVRATKLLVLGNIRCHTETHSVPPVKYLQPAYWRNTRALSHSSGAKYNTIMMTIWPCSGFVLIRGENTQAGLKLLRWTNTHPT